MIRRILAWLGITITPATAYSIQPDTWHHGTVYDWQCHYCRSARGTSPDLNGAHRSAQLHQLAAHSGVRG